jgi:putative tRNA adenosine deaminase-associated protein
MGEDDVDFALAAWRADDRWEIDDIAPPAYDSVDSVAHALRRFCVDGVAVGMIAVDEDFFVLVRVDDHHTRVLLSDVTAADQWELAESALDFLGLPPPEDDDRPAPAGDLDLLADLGVSAVELGELLDDVELFPDEMLSEVADGLGFGEEFDETVGLESDDGDAEVAGDGPA